MGGVELASVVRQLRAELNEALAGAQGERLRFELGPVQVSLSVTLGRDATPGAKVRFWVIEAGAEDGRGAPGIFSGAEDDNRIRRVKFLKGGRMRNLHGSENEEAGDQK